MFRRSKLVSNQSDAFRLLGGLVIIFQLSLLTLVGGTSEPAQAQALPVVRYGQFYHAPQPGSYKVVDAAAERLNFNHVVTLAALQGIHNQNTPTGGTALFVDWGDGATRYWRDYYKTTYKLNYSVQSVADTLRDSLSLTKQYVVWDPNNIETLNMAANLAGLFGAIPIAPGDESGGLNLKGLGYSLCAVCPFGGDLRGKFGSEAAVISWELDNLAKQFNQNLVYATTPGSGFIDQIIDIDYPVAAKAFIFFVNTKTNLALYRRILQSWPPGIHQMGWLWCDYQGVVCENEMRDVNSRLGNILLGSEAQRNSSFHTMFRPPDPVNPQREINAADVTLDPNGVYYSFTITDGDNMVVYDRLWNTTKDDYNNGVDYMLWADPKRGIVPIGWSLQPALRSFAPALLKKYFDDLANGGTYFDVAVGEQLKSDYFEAWLPAGYPIFDNLGADLGDRPGYQAAYLNWASTEIKALNLKTAFDIVNTSDNGLRTMGDRLGFNGWLRGWGSGGLQAIRPIGERQIPVVQTALIANTRNPDGIVSEVSRLARGRRGPTFISLLIPLWQQGGLEGLTQAVERLKTQGYHAVRPDVLLALSKRSTATSVAPNDLAYNRSVTVDSEAQGSLAHFAVDGNPATAWTSGTLPAPNWHWLNVDLDKPRAVESIKVSWQPGLKLDYWVQISSDGKEFLTVTTGSVGSNPVTLNRFTPLNARFVRVLITSVEGDRPAGINSLEINGRPVLSWDYAFLNLLSLLSKSRS